MSIIGNKHNTKMRFTFYNYDKGLFLDEKKKRFVDFIDMDVNTYKNYSDGFKYVNFITSSIAQTISETEHVNMTTLLSQLLIIY
jgi:hypothetical protein